MTYEANFAAYTVVAAMLVVVAITARAAQFTPGANRLIALCSEAGLLSSNYEGSLLRSVEFSAHD